MGKRLFLVNSRADGESSVCRFMIFHKYVPCIPAGNESNLLFADAFSVFIEILFQRQLCRKSGANERNELHCADDPADSSHTVRTFSDHKKHKQDSDWQHKQSRDIPHLTAIFMGKFPGVFIFHRPGRPVPKCRIDVFGGSF